MSICDSKMKYFNGTINMISVKKFEWTDLKNPQVHLVKISESDAWSALGGQVI